MCFILIATWTPVQKLQKLHRDIFGTTTATVITEVTLRTAT